MGRHPPRGVPQPRTCAGGPRPRARLPGRSQHPEQSQLRRQKRADTQSLNGCLLTHRCVLKGLSHSGSHFPFYPRNNSVYA